MAEQSDESIVKSLEPSFKIADNKRLKFSLIGLGVIVLGALSGFGVSRWGTAENQALKSPESVSAAGVKVGDIVGVADEKAFRDKAEGVLAEGGVDGEGSHHLLREGGPSQNVYLTSSIVDLNLFVGARVAVWGETFSAQKAGWLMDVGRVKVLKLNSPPPFAE